MEPIRITLVTAPGCHYCEEAQRMLESLSNRFAIAIDLVPLASSTGRDLVVEYRVPFPPLLLIDGSFFGHGRISQRKLEGRLGELELTGRGT